MAPDYQLIFLVLSLLAAAPVLYYYYRHNPNPRFRPRFGEMTLVVVLTVFVCAGFSYVVGGLLQNPDELRISKELTAPVTEPTPATEEEGPSKREERRGERRASRDSSSSSPKAR